MVFSKSFHVSSTGVEITMLLSLFKKLCLILKNPRLGPVSLNYRMPFIEAKTTNAVRLQFQDQQDPRVTKVFEGSKGLQAPRDQ